MNKISAAPLVHVPIDNVVIGTRRRQKLGRLQDLARSIAEHGLIHPILLRGDTLVAGHRRLEACRSLEWKTIPARQVDRLSDDQLRAIELDENSKREALSDFATSKARLAQIRQAEADLKAKAKEPKEVSAQPGQKPSKGGRPRKSASREAIAEELGTSRQEIDRVERHVALAEQYPFMQRQGWKRPDVLDAGDQLQQLPDEDRSPIAALLDQDAIPPERAIELLTHAAMMSPARRRSIVERATAEDAFVRRTALTDLGNVPPPPDPGLLALHDAAHAMTRAAASCRCADFKPRLTELSADVGDVLKAFSAHEKEARTNGSTV
jgi:hypothetical protein